MQNFASFRNRLAQRLRGRAARRRTACSAGPTGEDLKVIALLERLADDAEQLPQCLIDEAARLCRDPACARRFQQAWDIVPDILGVVLVPQDAVALVRWLIDQARPDPDPDSSLDPTSPRPCRRPPENRLARRIERTVPRSDGLLLTAASDFTGGIGMVAPMLAVWQVATALGQWRDHAFAASHPATAATVVAVLADDSGRGTAPVSAETVEFTPAGAHALCRVAVHLHGRHTDQVGQGITVVPRSGACEPPLVPDDTGDPVTSVLIALAYMASGVVSLKAWRWLLRRRFSRTAPVRTHPSTVQIAL